MSWSNHSSSFVLSNTSYITPEMLFEEAADTWLQSRIVAGDGSSKASRWAPRYIKRTTEDGYRQHLRALRLFFGGIRLCDIRLDHLRNYQRLRAEGGEPFMHRRRADEPLLPSPVKPAQVNKELALVIRLLKCSQLWGAAFQENFEELQVDPSEIQRALSHEEERRWLEVSRSNQRWWMVHWYSLLALATCMSTNEIRALRLRDVNLSARVLTVPVEGAKNRYRHRTIPLCTQESLWAVENLIQRAHSLGSTEPGDYLFPIRDKSNRYDPTRPMTRTGIKQIWDEVRVASGLKWFRPYDTRHTAITRMAESGTPLTVIMSFAGHISPHMTHHYTHISEQGKIKAMELAQRLRGPDPGEGAAAYFSTSPAYPLVPATRSHAPIRSIRSLPSASPAVAAPEDMNRLIQAEVARQVSLVLQANGINT